MEYPIIKMKLSPMQADCFTWASSATNDFILDPFNDDPEKPVMEDYAEAASIDEKDIWFIKNDYVIKDIIYRLEVMCPEMAEDADDKKEAFRIVRQGLKVAEKLRKFLPEEEQKASSINW